MKSGQMLDAFSETLLNDERILSVRERELLTNLLRNAKAASHCTEEIQNEVVAVIGRSVGETVAQRAFALLGSSIVEQIVSRELGSTSGRVSTWAGPQPPTAPTPEDPMEPVEEPDTTVPSGPQPPTASMRRSAVQENQHAAQFVRGGVGVLDPAEVEQAKCVVLDEFLAPSELDELIRYTLQHEQQFKSSGVVSPSGEMGVADYSHRRSQVLMDAGPHEDVILQRIRHVLPCVLAQMETKEFPITRTEVQITASNDGDFFRAHCDDAQELIASRRITFVYFFHREPRQFTGGELRLHDSQQGDHRSETGGYEIIVPQQNQIVFFPCSTLHEITPVHCSSGAFANSRFTVNGWLHH
jgi:Rps23 Pro-64 3,4-dihydroxylase Tpa1-like proline 4-hydroxylase